MKQFINTEETDWMRDYGVYAVNRDSRMFENTSAVKGYVIEIYFGLNENETSNRLADFLFTGSDYDYALYTPQHELCGFAYNPENANQNDWELPQRDISYGELAELGNLFEEELLEKGITLCDDEYRQEALFDFIDQYQNGNNNPELHLLYPERQIGLGSVVKFKAPVMSLLNNAVFQVTAVYRPGEITGGGKTNKSNEIVYQLSCTNKDYMPVMLGKASELEHI